MSLFDKPKHGDIWGSSTGSWAKEVGGVLRQTQDKKEYVQQVANNMDNLLDDTGSQFIDYGATTGYKDHTVNASDAKSLMSGIEAASGIALWEQDTLKLSSNIVSTDSETQVVEVSKALYGENEYKAPRNAVEMFLDVSGSLMQVGFDSDTKDIRGDEAGAAGFMNGTLGGWGQGHTAGGAKSDPRRDIYNNEIYQDGIFDKVDMNGETYVLEANGTYILCGLDKAPIYTSNNAAMMGMGMAGGGLGFDSGVAAYYGHSGSDNLVGSAGFDNMTGGVGLASTSSGLGGWGMDTSSSFAALYGNGSTDSFSGNSGFDYLTGGVSAAGGGIGFGASQATSSAWNSLWGGGQEDKGWCPISGGVGSTAVADNTAWFNGVQKEEKASNEAANNFYAMSNYMENDPNKWTG